MKQSYLKLKHIPSMTCYLLEKFNQFLYRNDLIIQGGLL